jgi:DNA polymerase III alpha subunit (gram-positive type)
MRILDFQELVRRYFSGESFVVFDTETTGLNTFHDDIIEIAGMIWKKGEDPVTFQELIRVNPNKISKEAWNIHKIPMEEIEAARPAAAVFNDFLAFAEGRPLIAHNIRYDFEILNSNLIKNGLRPYPNEDVACTYLYSKGMNLPGSLVELALAKKITPKEDQLHRALYDVKVLKEVLDQFMAENEPKDLQYSLIF